MKPLYLLFTLLISTAFIPLTQAAPRIGEQAPGFTLTSSDGSTVSLSDFSGNYVILEWTNHACPFVHKHYGHGNMQSIQQEETAKGTVWLTIISSAEGKQGHISAARANEITAMRKARPTHVLFDTSGDVGRKYGAKTTPHMYIITPEGTLVYMGAIDSIKSANPADIPKATNYVLKAMAELRRGANVSESVTPPYGCSVKY